MAILIIFIIQIKQPDKPISYIYKQIGIQTNKTIKQPETIQPPKQRQTLYHSETDLIKESSTKPAAKAALSHEAQKSLPLPEEHQVFKTSESVVKTAAPLESARDKKKPVEWVIRVGKEVQKSIPRSPGIDFDITAAPFTEKKSTRL